MRRRKKTRSAHETRTIAGIKWTESAKALREGERERERELVHSKNPEETRAMTARMTSARFAAASSHERPRNNAPLMLQRCFLSLSMFAVESAISMGRDGEREGELRIARETGDRE